VGDVLADTLRALVKPCIQSNQFAGIDKPLQIDKRDTRSLEIASPHDALGFDKFDGPLSMTLAMLDHVI
jgi:hypothetical protein